MNSKLRFLGTGSSLGVPVIGCKCAICKSSNPKNRRARPGALLTIGEKNILIDVSQDFREQALTYEIDDIDGVIITHPHHDHISGVDDLRIYKKPLPCLVSNFTKKDLEIRYDYLFKPTSHPQKLVTGLDFVIAKDQGGHTPFLELDFHTTHYFQVEMPVLGFRIGNFAYITDIRSYPETIFTDLSGVKTLVLSALRNEPSPLHFGLEEAVEFAKRVGSEQTWLIHIAHELDHETTNASLPKEVQLAYDGQEIWNIL